MTKYYIFLEIYKDYNLSVYFACQAIKNETVQVNIDGLKDYIMDCLE